MKKVLVAVDGSTQSEKALDYAIRDTDKINSSLTIIHAITSLQHDDESSSEAHKEEVKNAEEYLNKLRDKAENEGVKADVEIVIGSNAANEIVKFAKEREFDKIVVGSHGRTGLETVNLGSVSESIVKRAPCPVLVVR